MAVLPLSSFNVVISTLEALMGIGTEDPIAFVYYGEGLSGVFFKVGSFFKEDLPLILIDDLSIPEGDPLLSASADIKRHPSEETSPSHKST